MEELIKKALVAAGLPEGLHKFVSALTTEESKIASTVAEIKKMFPALKTYSNIDEVLADQTLKEIVSKWKDKNVNDGVKTFLMNHPEDLIKARNFIKLIETTGNGNDTDGDGKTKTDGDGKADPGKTDDKKDATVKAQDEKIDKLAETVDKLAKLLGGVVTESKSKETEIRKIKVLKEKKVPDALHSQFKVDENISDEDLEKQAEDFKNVLVEAGFEKMSEPKDGTSGAMTDTEAKEIAETRNEGGGGGGAVSGKLSSEKKQV